MLVSLELQRNKRVSSENLDIEMADFDVDVTSIDGESIRVSNSEAGKD